MTTSRLKNVYLKTRNSKNWEKYKKQRNFGTNLLEKTKSEYFRNLNKKDLFFKRVLFIFHCSSGAIQPLRKDICFVTERVAVIHSLKGTVFT